MRSYYRALLDGDGARACKALTPALARDIAAAPAAQNVGGSCPDVLKLAAGLNPDRAGDDLHALDVDVARDGDRASARLANPLTGKRESLRLERVGGEWKLASLVLRPRG